MPSDRQKGRPVDYINFDFEKTLPITDITFSVPSHFWESPNVILRMHWGQQSSYGRRWRTAINSQIPAQKSAEFAEAPKALWITRIIAGSSKFYDCDNMVGSVKSHIDSLVRLGWLKDDNHKYLPQGCLRADQERRFSGGSACRIRIYYADGGPDGVA